MNSHTFLGAVRELRFDDCFNPYVDRCAVHDHSDAPERRFQALAGILTRAIDEQIDAIWIGRDLGYRGGRRTGLALTDDIHVPAHTQRWNFTTERATTGSPMSERTAAVIWSALNQIEAHTFLWNVFPLHPHEPGDPFSNRQHNARERRAGEEILEILLTVLKPKRIVALGNNAAVTAVHVAGIDRVTCVRHPSYGGQTQFLRQVSEIYGLLPRSGRLL